LIAAVEAIRGLVSFVKSVTLASDLLKPITTLLDSKQWLSLNEDELGIFRTPEGTIFRKNKTSGYRVVQSMTKEEQELEEMRKAKLRKQVRSYSLNGRTH
jgi:hypothetical protein